jgi:hypothetical protein
MYKEFYVSDVSFKDPMISIGGISAYEANIDMLSGRNALGAFLFKDASIELHDVVQYPNEPLRLTTRWTLQLCMKVLPWQPYARFSGVSEYTLNEQGLVVGQQVSAAPSRDLRGVWRADAGRGPVDVRDCPARRRLTGDSASLPPSPPASPPPSPLRPQDYWDSINLDDGRYTTRSPLDALADFATQLSVKAGPKRLPYSLLRRGRSYDVRRYARGEVPRLVAAGGAAAKAPSTVAVGELPPGASASAVGEAAASVRATADKDGLRTLPGYWVASGGSGPDEVWIGLKNEAREVWPVK